jgi:hypothetical protein
MVAGPREDSRVLPEGEDSNSVWGQSFPKPPAALPGLALLSQPQAAQMRSEALLLPVSSPQALAAPPAWVATLE